MLRAFKVRHKVLDCVSNLGGFVLCIGSKVRCLHINYRG